MDSTYFLRQLDIADPSQFKDNPPIIPVDRQARLDCMMLKVTHEEVSWEKYIFTAHPVEKMDKMGSVELGHVDLPNSMEPI